MKRQSEAYESMVYAYACGEPLAGEDAAMAELARCRELWDRLVEIDRAAERALLDAAGRDVPEIAASVELAWLLTAQLRETKAERSRLVTATPEGVVLLRYRTVEDLARYRPDMRELPLPVHGALVDRLRVALARRGIRVRVVWMEREAYDAWRGRRRDAEDVRAAWAALQIPAAPAAAPEA